VDECEALVPGRVGVHVPGAHPRAAGGGAA
jgi:hypothetical protein